MSDKISDLEARVGGALREIAQHASASSPGRGAIRDQLTADRGRSPGWLRPAAAAAAVVAVVGGLGAAIASQLNGTADPEEDPVANGFAEPGGTPPVTGKSDPAAGSIDAVNRTAARLTAHYDAPGYGKVEVDYDRATVTVLWSGQPPAGVTALEGPRPNGVTVILRQSAYSEAQLAAAARQVVDAPNDQVDGANIAAAMPNADRSGLVVEILRPWHGSTVEVENVARVPVTVRLVDDAPQPLTD